MNEKEEKKEIFPKNNKNDVKKIEESVESVIYLGPDIKNVLRTNVIYINGLPNIIKDYIKKCPSIEKLFCKTSKINEFKQKLKEKGTIENIHYNKVIEFLKKEE